MVVHGYGGLAYGTGRHWDDDFTNCSFVQCLRDEMFSSALLLIYIANMLCLNLYKVLPS